MAAVDLLIHNDFIFFDGWNIQYWILDTGYWRLDTGITKQIHQL